MAAAGVRSVMPAHNTVLDIPCHANKWLIGDVLRDGFGFGHGVALSDCNDVAVLVDYRVAANRSHAAAISLRAGVDWDLQCGSDPTKWSFNTLNQSLEEGLITPHDLDETVPRVLTHKFANGLFDEAPTDPAGTAVLDSPAHRTLGCLNGLSECDARSGGIVMLARISETTAEESVPCTAKCAPSVLQVCSKCACSKCACVWRPPSLVDLNACIVTVKIKWIWQEK
jgi:hypothetical protein